MTRPGAAYLPSLIREDRIGQPGPAREAALRAADEDPAQRAEHLLDAALASLMAGAPTRALHDLERLEAEVGEDEVWQRRLRAGRVWARQLDGNAYPGGIGADVAEARSDLALEPTAGDPETQRLELVVAMGPDALRTIRTLLDQSLRWSAPALGGILEQGLQQLGTFFERMQELGHRREAAWAVRANADLLWRANRPRDALAQLGALRQALAQQEDSVGVALTHLTEGDWFAAPAASPEALGHELSDVNRPSPLSAYANPERARGAYDQARALLEGLDLPAFEAAIHLRMAFLARLEGREDWARPLAPALQASGRAGAELATVTALAHGFLARIESSPLGELRSDLGSGWSAPSEGPIQAIREWAREQGSASYAAGLGRLLEREGDRRKEDGDHERASACYVAAIPLQAGLPALNSYTLHSSIASVDMARGLHTRALLRLERASQQLPPLTMALDAPLAYQRHAELAASVIQCVTGFEGRLGGPVTVDAIEHAQRRFDLLLALPGLDSLEVDLEGLAPDDKAALEALSASMSGRSFDELVEASQRDMTDIERQALALTWRSLREQRASLDVELPRTRAEQAIREGRLEEADRWFELALRHSGEPGVPAWQQVLVLVRWGRDEEASEQLETHLAEGSLSPLFITLLALQAGDAALARRALAGVTLPAETWRDAQTQAELFFAEGRLAETRAAAARGLEGFERIVAGLGRDPERLAASDESIASRLYLLAALAELGTNDMPVAGQDADAQAAQGRAFAHTERSRSIALESLLRPDIRALDDELRRPWWQAAAEWAAANDQMLARVLRADVGHGQLLAGEDVASLDRAEENLVTMEARIEREAPNSEILQPPLPRPPELPQIRRRLPSGALLLAYHGIGRDLLAWAISEDEVRSHRVSIHSRRISGLVHRFQQACSVGAAPQEEGEALRALLLAPFEDLLASHERLLVLPSGPLHILPFHALPMDSGPLGLSHTLSYLPSAAMLLRAGPDAPVGTGPAVVVGDPAFRAGAQPALRRLAGSAVEARAVARHYDARTVLIGEEAGEEALREALSDVSVLHLAAHGRLDPIAPMLSSIVLSGDDQLTVADLMGLQLNADLAVLSACDSGRGRTTLGADVVGLVRGLLAAGVRRAILSLWPVDDVSACVTMALLHERLAEGLPPAAALARAQREVHALRGEDIVARYEALGGTAVGGQRTVRRGDPELDPELLDEEPLPDPLEDLHGDRARVWAPFVLVGA